MLIQMYFTPIFLSMMCDNVTTQHPLVNMFDKLEK